MIYNEGDKLVNTEMNLKCTVIMTNAFEMTIVSDDGSGHTWIMNREDPEGFRPLEALDGIEFEPMEIQGMTLKTLDEIKFDLYVKHLEMKNFNVDKAIIATRAVLYGVFHDKESLDV